MATFTKIGIDKLNTWLKDNLLLLLTFTGVLGGFIMGLLLRSFNLSNEAILLIAYPGEIFMRLLKLMILPLIIASLITGAASLNAKMNGMIALRTIMYFIATSLISACVGLILVIVIHPGSSEVKTLLGSGTTTEKKIDIIDNFLDLGRNLIPDNLFKAAFETAGTKHVSSVDGSQMTKVLSYRPGTNTLGIIFFCLTFGTVLGSLGRKAQIVIEFFSNH